MSEGVLEFDDDMYADEVVADPYAYYGRLREHAPVYWNARYGTWLVTRHEDVVWLLRNPDLFSSRFYADDPQPPSPPIHDEDAGELAFVSGFRSHEMIQNDLPDHGRMRGIFRRYFTPAQMERWREMVRGAVSDLLDEALAGDVVDLRADVGAELPLRVISELLGVRPQDRAALKEHADRRMQSALSLEPDRMRVGASGIRDTSEYLTAMLDVPSGEPEELLSLLLAAEEAGTYSRDEVLANAQMLIDAGHETTIQLICNGALAFLRHPDQWARFVAAPRELAVSAVEECLRFDPPLPAPRRLASHDLELRGATIRRGDRVAFVIAAANRDPRVFTDPDTFDIGRTPNRHIAFGSGLHVCLGQHLARIEGQEVLAALAERWPGMASAGGPVEYAKVRGVRSLLRLDVAR